MTVATVTAPALDWPNNSCGDCGEDLSKCNCEGAR